MKTKRILGTIAAVLFLQQGFAQQNAGKPFTISGSLNGAHVDSVMFYYEDAAGKHAHEGKPVVNNTFTLSGNISQPVSARIMFKKTGEVISRDDQQDRMREFYIEPGTLSLSGDPAKLQSLKLTGSKTEDEYEELEAKIAPIREEMKTLEGAKKITYQFFTEHPNSYVTLDMMRYYVSRMGLDSTKQVYNAFNDELKATASAKDLLQHIKQIEAGLPGAVAPVFTKTDIKGKQLSLGDFKGRYVMLDFWASWCVPCRKSNPHMVELYNKYKGNGFDVIGIADDDGKIEVWNAAVAKDGVGIWHNVLRGLKMDMIMHNIPNPDDLDQQYGIASIPTKILIGPDGKILGRYGDCYGGTEEDMDKMLVSIFDK